MERDRVAQRGSSTAVRRESRPGADKGTADKGKGSGGVLATIVKIVLLGTAVGVAAALTPGLLATGRWYFLAVIWGIVAALLVTYATGRFIPAKYLVPGTLFLLLFVVYPILMTFQLSTTNFGDGTRNTKEVTISRIIGNAAQQVEGARTFELAVASQGTATSGPYTFLLLDPQTGDVFAGTEDGLDELDADAVTVEDDAITAADGFTILENREVNELSQQGGPLEGFAVPTEDGVIRAQGFSAVELFSPLEYDEASDTITNVQTGVEYTPVQSGDRKFFTSADGERLSDQSWGENIGFANYARALTDPTIARDFFGIFLWTLAFAVLSVGTTFALGLFLATVLNDSRLRGQRAYRSLLLLPYAIPGFISLLVWSSFYNREFGLINNLSGLDVNWFGDPVWAKVAVLLANLWMGFPYMFLVATGALQSIPSDLKEAASLDGATGWTNFRKITFPLLLVSVAPLLVASFAMNFNNFGAIFLLTEGGPFSPDNPTAGGTDILISYTYRLAFGGGAQLIGFASAISVLLFIITGVLAAIQFRATRALEEI
jgi:arabinogalactan oligomer/maltooligosaccharide transport system permease protein